jgi:hypothetical protein
MATDTSQRKINLLSPDSRGFVLWNTVTVVNVTADDKTELFDIPENCRIIGAALTVDTIDSGTAITYMLEADVLGGALALLAGTVNGKTLNLSDVLLNTIAGRKLVPLASEKHVTIQVDVATVTAGGGDGVVTCMVELVRDDYDRS